MFNTKIVGQIVDIFGAIVPLVIQALAHSQNMSWDGTFGQRAIADLSFEQIYR